MFKKSVKENGNFTKNRSKYKKELTKYRKQFKTELDELNEKRNQQKLNKIKKMMEKNDIENKKEKNPKIITNINEQLQEAKKYFLFLSFF